MRPPSSSTIRSNSCVEPRLADPGRPDHRHEMRDALAGDLLPDPAQHVELAEAADQRARVRDARRRRASAAARPRPRPARPCPSPGRPPSRSYSIASLVPAYVSPPTITPFTGAADCRREAVLTTSPATSDSPRAMRAPSETSASPVFTAIRSWRSRCSSPRVELERAVAHRQRAAHRALGVVAVGGRRAEDRHDRVADELLHGSAERLELSPDVLVVRAQDAPARPRGRGSRRGR